MLRPVRYPSSRAGPRNRRHFKTSTITTLSTVILGLVPRIHPSVGSGVRWTLDPRTKCEDDLILGRWRAIASASIPAAHCARGHDDGGAGHQLPVRPLCAIGRASARPCRASGPRQSRSAGLAATREEADRIRPSAPAREAVLQGTALSSPRHVHASTRAHRNHHPPTYIMKRERLSPPRNAVGSRTALTRVGTGDPLHPASRRTASAGNAPGRGDASGG
jgi:hypothetical protein